LFALAKSNVVTLECEALSGKPPVWGGGGINQK